jgi:hypothetical protein
MKRLSEEYNTNEYNEHIEEMLWEESIIIDKGFYLEVYGNSDGKYDEESSEGASYFVYIDKELTYGQFLDIFSDMGSVKDDTLTIRVMSENEKQEREFCKENPISKLLK